MSVITYEGIIEDGQIKLAPSVHLPNHTKVYVVVPEAPEIELPRVSSPRLKYPEQITDFKMEILPGSGDANL